MSDLYDRYTIILVVGKNMCATRHTSCYCVCCRHQQKRSRADTGVSIVQMPKAIIDETQSIKGLCGLPESVDLAAGVA